MVGQVEPEVRVYPDLNSASRAAAEELVKLIIDSVNESGRFSIALSGGNTTRTLYALLADEYSDQIPWGSVHIFWGDERYVSKNHADSNYGMANQALLSKVSIPSQNVHRIQTEMESPDKAASSYERVLREFFHSAQADESAPTFDLTLLGVGNDGHTASLFPGDPVLKERERWVAAVNASP
ncbi:MAG: 6-phosphogluconolactonase, partial [Candidatus Hydrothermarchaeales archaeon]